MVKISVVLPIYNREQYLENTLNAIINQTFEDFEVICINDGSTDNSLDIVNEFSKDDSRIKVFTQDNLGAGCARNNGLKRAEGQYVFFMDSDDFIVPSFLERILDNIAVNDPDMVMFKIGTIKKNKKIKSTTLFPIDEYFDDVDFSDYTFNYEPIKKEVLNSSFAPWGKVFKKEFLDKHADFVFDENLAYEDVLFHIKTMLCASKISFVPEYLYFYRIDTDNSLTSYDETHFDIIKVVENVEKYLTDNGYLEEFEKEYELFRLTQITRHISIPADEKYFKTAKTLLEGIDISENDLIYPALRRKLEIFYDCQTAECYQKKVKVHFLKEEHMDLKRQYNKLKNENRNLKKKRDYQKNLNEKLMSSSSWKLTKPIRNISDVFK